MHSKMFYLKRRTNGESLANDSLNDKLCNINKN